MKTKFEYVVLILCITLAFSMVMMGATVSAKEWPKSLVLATPPAGSSLSVYGIGVAKIIETTLKITTGPENANGGLEAALLLIRGHAQLAATPGCEATYAINDRDPFPKGSSKIMRGITFGEYNSVAHWMARVDSGIRSIKDLKGKRVMCLRPGQASYEDNWRATIEAYGMKPDDIVAKPALGQRDAAVALKEGKADAFFHYSSDPGPAFIETDLVTPLRCIPLTQEAYKKVEEKLGWIGSYVVKAGTYRGQTEDALQTMLPAGIMIRSEMPDDLVYSIAKAIHENTKELTALHSSFSKWTIEGLVNGQVTCPYHAGALKYYKEKGLVTEKSLKKHNELLAKIGQER